MCVWEDSERKWGMNTDRRSEIAARIISNIRMKDFIYMY